MPNTESHTEIFRKLSAEDLLLMAALLLATWLLASMVRWMLH